MIIMEERKEERRRIFQKEIYKLMSSLISSLAFAKVSYFPTI